MLDGETLLEVLRETAGDEDTLGEWVAVYMPLKVGYTPVPVAHTVKLPVVEAVILDEGHGKGVKEVECEGVPSLVPVAISALGEVVWEIVKDGLLLKVDLLVGIEVPHELGV